MTATAAATGTTRTTGGGSGLLVETRREKTRRLPEVLGDDRLRALRDQGAAMDTDQAVAYTLTHLATYLRNEEQPTP